MNLLSVFRHELHMRKFEKYFPILFEYYTMILYIINYIFDNILEILLAISFMCMVFKMLSFLEVKRK